MPVYQKNHRYPHHLAGFPVVLNDDKSSQVDTRFPEGETFQLVDWLDRIIGGEWKDLKGNNALASTYGKRYIAGMKGNRVPIDSEVVVVKNAAGDLYPLHQSEIIPGEVGQG